MELNTTGTDLEHEFLVARRCPLGQGFLFGRPVPAEEVPLL